MSQAPSHLGNLFRMLAPSALAPLPERARLLHIGPMKSGTTAVQRAAHRRRAALLKHGVRYPGSGLNHYAEVCAFMGRRKEGKVPPAETWERLMAEVEADDTNRIFINHEWICEADDRMAQRFIEALGKRTHVAITLRPLSGMLSSFWQEIVKNGAETRPFDEWLRNALAKAPGERRETKWDRQSDQAGIVERWERLLGADRVTVVIADKTNPQIVPSTLERLLVLPAGTLDDPDKHGRQANRSLSAPEAEFFRRLNVTFKEHNMPFVEYAITPRRGAVSRVLNMESLRPDNKIQLPTWAAERATEFGKEIANRLGMSEARIVGDLASLHAPVSSTINDPQPTIDAISMDVAVEAMAGTVSAMSGRGPNFAVKKNKTMLEQTSPRLGDRIRRLPFGDTVIRLARKWREWRTG